MIKVTEKHREEQELKDFVEHAEIESIHAHADAEDERRFQTRTFRFARMCKAHPQLSRLSADRVVEKVAPFFSRFDDEDIETLRAELAKVVYEDGERLLDKVVKRAAVERIKLPGRTRLYNQALTILYHLQRAMGDRDIYLSTRRLAGVLKLRSHVTAGAILKNLVHDGFLWVRKEHTIYEATRYRVNLEKLKREK